MASQDVEMKNNVIIWILKKNRRWLPGLILLTLSQVGNAVFGVMFALGSRAVIDAAVDGQPGAFSGPVFFSAPSFWDCRSACF